MTPREEIVNKVHKQPAFEFVQRQCGIFFDRVEVYAERAEKRLNQWLAELDRRINKIAPGAEGNDRLALLDAVLKEERKGGPPKPGYVWSNGNDYWGLDFFKFRARWINHWRPADDVNPLLYFETAESPVKGTFVTPAAQRIDQKDTTLQVLFASVLLAVAHDYDPTLSKAWPRMLDDRRESEYWDHKKFLKQVWNALNKEGGNAEIERAWARVMETLQLRRGQAGEVDEARQPAKNSGTQVNVSIQNSTVTVGDIRQTQNLAAGTRRSVGKELQTSAKRKRTIWKIIGALASLLTLLEILFGWIGSIWRFIAGR